jgi:hypothetical protein
MAIKFQTNIPLTLTFPFGDFREINGQYGQQFAYTVEVDGERDKLFATPLLHQELQAAGVGPGAVLTISKVEAEGNRKSWLVRPEEAEDTEDEPEGNGALRPGKAAPAPTTPPPAPTNGRQPQADHPDFADMQALMGHCLKASWDAWQGVDDGDFAFSSEDVRGVGITLFLECARKGVLPQAVEEGLPF